MENILLTAKEHGHRSIAIPCLGVVGLGYKPEFSARVLFESVVSFHYKHPSAITQFYFIVHRKGDEQAFYEEYEKRIEQFAKISLPSPPRPSTSSGNKHGFDPLDVEIIKGDLTKEQTEVIVNSTSIDIREDANQISRALFAAAGNDMRDACSGLVNSGVLLADGLVIPTNASGELRCDKVYHVHVPGKLKRDVPPTPAEAALLKKVVYGCLEIAEETKQESLSFPAFCLGIGNYTIEQSGGLMFEAIGEFVQMSPKYLKSVRIVIRDKPLYDDFLQFYKQGTSGFRKKPPNHAGLKPRSVTQPTKPSYATAGELLKPSSCKKNAVHFHLFGIKKDKLDNTEKELKIFINESIVTDMVELGETIKLFHQNDLDVFFELAFQHSVEIDVQLDFERVLFSGEEMAVEKLCTKVQQKKIELQALTNELQLYQWFGEDLSGIPVSYPQDVMMQIEVGYKRKLDSINIVIDRTHVRIDFLKMEEQDNTGGFRKKIARRRRTLEMGELLHKLLVHLLIASLSNILNSSFSSTEIPKEWTPQPCDSQGTPKIVHFETISKFSSEYAQATKRFNETLNAVNCTIVSVQRIQNPGEYSRYQSLKTSWESIHGQGVVKEKELFHGTKEESVVPICSQGFNRIFAADNNGMWFL